MSGRTGKKPVVGLSGGIGAGKSAVAKLLTSLGAAVLDSDRLAHEELGHPEVVPMIRSWWGDRVLTPSGSPDRRAIADIVFNSPAELRRLEGLLYPRLKRRRDQDVARLQADPSVRAIVLDAPKLYEAGLQDECDFLIYVDADWASRAKRVAEQRGWSEAELKRREDLQVPLDIKKANADYVIDNHSSLDELRPEVEGVFSAVLASFSESPARVGRSSK